MKYFRLFTFLIVSLSMFIGSTGWSCISLPKNVKLKNSPFPFSEFNIFANSFSYETEDGTENRLNCDVKDNYSWSIDSFPKKGERASYAYADFKDAEVFADENEKGAKTKITFGDTADMAYVSIKRKGGMASLQVTCTKEGKYRKLAVKVINSQGKAIGEISSSKDMTAPQTRSLSVSKKENGVIDFNSREKVGGEFVSSGCGFQEEVKSGAKKPAGANE